MSEEELIKNAQNGDKEAIELLLNENKQLVKYVVRHYFLIGGDVDDLMQEGMIALYKAINSFKISKNIPFSSYAKIIIERQIINAIKEDNNLNNSVLNGSYTLSNQGGVNFDEKEIEFIIPSEKQTPESYMISSEKTKDIIKKIKEHLSKYEYNVLRYYLKGINYCDIAKILKKSPKSIDNALNRIKNKLKFLKEEL